MVVKPTEVIKLPILEFESRVILDGSQTYSFVHTKPSRFESRVILDGSQTGFNIVAQAGRFESRVILDGSQTLLFPVSKV